MERVYKFIVETYNTTDTDYVRNLAVHNSFKFNAQNMPELVRLSEKKPIWLVFNTEDKDIKCIGNLDEAQRLVGYEGYDIIRFEDEASKFIKLIRITLKPKPLNI